MQLAATSGGSTPPAGWTDVTPPDLLPASLSAGSAGVLIGGSSDETDQRPVLAVRDGTRWQNIPATATTGYGAMAEIVQLDLSPDQQIVAIGTVAGGAHLNPRWSAWIGSTAGITEESQTAETFGGPEAGGIIGVLSGPAPLVIGSWTIASGVVGAAFWLHSPESIGGQTWQRQPSPVPLAGSAQELITPTAAAWSTAEAAASRDSAAAAAGDDHRVVIAGLATSFRDGVVHQQAIVLMSSGGPSLTDPQTWTRVDLVNTDQDSAATDVSCAGSACIVVGRLGAQLAAWRLDPTVGAASRIDGIPDRPVDRYLGQPRVGVDGAEAVIAPGGSGDPLLTSGPTGWTSVPSPAGEQRRVGVANGTLYLLLRPEQGPQVVYAEQ